MKKILLLFVLFFSFSLISSAQVYISFDSISSPPYICQATAFNVEVFGARSNSDIQDGPQNYTLSHDTVYVNFYFQRGLSTTFPPPPIHRQILIQAPTIGQYKIHVRGYLLSWTSAYDTINSKISVCSGIAGANEPLKADHGIGIFPNPANDKLTLTGFSADSRFLKATISDVTGKICQAEEFKPEQEKEINIENLSKGIYLLKLQTENGLIIRRLLKE